MNRSCQEKKKFVLVMCSEMLCYREIQPFEKNCDMLKKKCRKLHWALSKYLAIPHPTFQRGHDSRFSTNCSDLKSDLVVRSLRNAVSL